MGNSVDDDKICSVSELRKICHSFYMDPKGPLSEAVSRKTYYKISIYFTWIFLHTNVTPNQVTLLSLLAGLVGCVMLSLPAYYPILGVILFQFWHVLDMVDGEIARYKDICSLTGAFFDRLNTAIVEACMYSSLAYSLYLKFGDVRSFIFGFSASISILLLKIIFSYLHVAAIEPILHQKHSKMFKKIKETDLKDIGLLSDYLSARPSSNFMRIAELLIGYGLYFGMFMAVIVDSIFCPSISLFSFKLNLSYLYLMSVGVALPFAFLFLTIYVIRNKAPEGIYFEIIRTLSNTRNKTRNKSQK